MTDKEITEVFDTFVARQKIILLSLLEDSILKIRRTLLSIARDSLENTLDLETLSQREEEINRIYTRIKSIYKEYSKEAITRAYLQGRSVAANLIKNANLSPAQGILDSKTIDIFVREMARDFTIGLEGGRRVIGSFFVFSKQGILTERQLTRAVATAIIEDGTLKAAEQKVAGVLREKLRSLPKGKLQKVTGTAEDSIINAYLEEAKNAGATERQIRNFKRILKTDGFIRIINKNGEPMVFRVSTYAEFVARTRMGNAQVFGMVDMCSANGIELFKVTSHNSENFCYDYEGNVLTTNNKYVGLKYTNKKFSDERLILPFTTGNRPLFHINCKHRVIPYVLTKREIRNLYIRSGREIPKELEGVAA